MIRGSHTAGQAGRGRALLAINFSHGRREDQHWGEIRAPIDQQCWTGTLDEAASLGSP